MVSDRMQSILRKLSSLNENALTFLWQHRLCQLGWVMFLLLKEVLVVRDATYVELTWNETELLAFRKETRYISCIDKIDIALLFSSKRNNSKILCRSLGALGPDLYLDIDQRGFRRRWILKINHWTSSTRKQIAEQYQQELGILLVGWSARSL